MNLIKDRVSIDELCIVNIITINNNNSQSLIN